MIVLVPVLVLRVVDGVREVGELVVRDEVDNWIFKGTTIPALLQQSLDKLRGAMISEVLLQTGKVRGIALSGGSLVLSCSFNKGHSFLHTSSSM